ncbi:MAG: tyrosine-type recombinase/integrase [Actinomycetota bacterium]|nr:tyrosine-type recombinase/integrase [Actinomycetota bacterium]
MSARATTGIRARHGRACATASDPAARCTCRPSWEASVYLKREGRKIRKTFATKADAKAWRSDTASAAGKGKVRAPSSTTVEQAWSEFYAGALSGAIRSRRNARYKPSVIRGYETSMRLHLLPALGHRHLGDVTDNDVQDIADELHAAGASASTIKNALDPLRVIYRRARKRHVVAVTPFDDDLELEGRPETPRVRATSPGEASALLAALPETDRALWATAFYAGLRRGELRALRFSDVDLAAREIHVRRTWDDVAGEQHGGKSKAAMRTVPILAPLVAELAAHRLATGRGEGDLIFGATGSRPFSPPRVRARALAAWKAHNAYAPAGEQLAPITLHEARHSAASTFIAAGANAKVIQTLMGHATIKMTFDRYGHLFPGQLDQARDLADAFLEPEGRRLHAVGDPE